MKTKNKKNKISKDSYIVGAMFFILITILTLFLGIDTNTAFGILFASTLSMSLYFKTNEQQVQIEELKQKIESIENQKQS